MQVLLEKVEIAVTVQELVPTLNAEGCDKTVNRTSDGNPDFAKAAVVAGCSNGHWPGQGIKDRQRAKELLGVAKTAVEADPLQNLRKHEGGQAYRSDVFGRSEPTGLRCNPLIQEVNPNR